MGIFDTITTILKKQSVMFGEKDANFDDIIHNIKEQMNTWENTKVRIAITGQSGSGKSSLLNAIAGKKIASVGFTETTMQAQEYDTENGIILVDLPGCGTKNFPFESYTETMQLDTFDAIILVTSNRFYESDVKLYHHVINELEKPIFLVRTKMDQAIIDGEEENDFTRDQVIERVLQDIAENTDIDNLSKIYLVSSKKNKVSEFDTTRLIKDISESLSDIKKEKFISDAAAYSEDAIRAKKVIINEVVERYAYLSAANGLNPIPGFNVAVDIGLLVKLTNYVLKSYGLVDSTLAEYLKKNQDHGKISGTLNGTAKWLAIHGTEAGIKSLLSKFASVELARTVGAWIPIVGQVVAAGIGYKMTMGYGLNLVEESEAKAIDLLNAYIKDNS